MDALSLGLFTWLRRLFLMLLRQVVDCVCLIVICSQILAKYCCPNTELASPVAQPLVLDCDSGSWNNHNRVGHRWEFFNDKVVIPGPRPIIFGFRKYRILRIHDLSIHYKCWMFSRFATIENTQSAMIFLLIANNGRRRVERLHIHRDFGVGVIDVKLERLRLAKGDK